MSAMTAAKAFLMSNTPDSLAFVFRNKMLHYNAATAFSSQQTFGLLLSDRAFCGQISSYFQTQLYYALTNCIRLFYSHEIQRCIVVAFFIHF